jgi:aryl-alcohol dehydrogenase-like predicted oxidoreductase
MRYCVVSQQRWFVLSSFWLTVVVTAPIVGLNSEERIKEMVEAVNFKLTDEELKSLEEPYVPRPIVGHS